MTVSCSVALLRLIFNLLLCSNIRMVYPHRTIAVDGYLRNKIASYLATNYNLSHPQALKYVPTELSSRGLYSGIAEDPRKRAGDSFKNHKVIYMSRQEPIRLSGGRIRTIRD
jgi:hypothetical protein